MNADAVEPCANHLHTKADVKVHSAALADDISRINIAVLILHAVIVDLAQTVDLGICKEAVIHTQNKRSALLCAVKYLQLCRKDILLRAELFDMRNAYVGDNADRRLAAHRHTRYLAPCAHAHFYNSCLRILFKPEKCFGHTYLVIQIALCFERFILLRNDQRYHILCGSLSHAARNAYKRNVELIPVIACKVKQSLCSRVNNNAPRALDSTLGYDRLRAKLHSLCRKIVSVKARSFERKKYRAFAYGTGVGGYIIYPYIRIVAVAAVYRADYFRQFYLFHTRFNSSNDCCPDICLYDYLPSLASSSSASATTSRSSKCIFTPPASI